MMRGKNVRVHYMIRFMIGILFMCWHFAQTLSYYLSPSHDTACSHSAFRDNSRTSSTPVAESLVLKADVVITPPLFIFSLPSEFHLAPQKCIRGYLLDLALPQNV